MGARTFEELLEQDAIRFVVWEPSPFMSHKDGKVGALFMARIGSGELDLEKIIEQGFEIEETGLASSNKRSIKRKLIEQHSILNPAFGSDAWAIALKALSEGSLQHIGLTPRDNMIGAPVEDGEVLLSAAQSLLAYRHILENGMTSADSEGVYDLFARGLTSLESPTLPIKRFGIIAEFEQFPDLRSLYKALEHPFRDAAKFRHSHVASNFRVWLAGISGDTEVAIIREYVDALAKRKGLFDSNPRKFLKLVSMAAIGSGASAGATALGADMLMIGLTGLAAPVVAQIVEKGVEFGLGVTETFLIDNIKTGWTPRAYFNGLRKIKQSSVESRPDARSVA
jgi:hypothetical protein